MKQIKPRSLFLVILIITSILFNIASAVENEGGAMAGGGGDAGTELRIKEIRDDILKWIKAGGAEDLIFSADSTYGDYLNGSSQKNIYGMLDLLKPGRVVINTFHKWEESEDEFENNTLVSGKPKICKGFVSKKDNQPYINCSVEKFNELSEAQQYMQVHHEYAGLGNLEKNNGPDSDYSLSTQITNFLEEQQVLKLAVKDFNDGVMLEEDNINIKDIGNVRNIEVLKDIKVNPNSEKTKIDGTSCYLEHDSQSFHRKISKGKKLTFESIYFESVYIRATYDANGKMYRYGGNATYHKVSFGLNFNNLKSASLIYCIDYRGASKVTIGDLKQFLEGVLAIELEDPKEIE